MSRVAHFVAVVALVSACAPSGFSRDDAARICSTIQVCNPDEFYLFGGNLPACTADKGFLPRPGSLETSPALEDGMEEPLRAVFTCLIAARGDCEKAARCWAQVGEADACTPASSLLSASCEASVVTGCSSAGRRFALDCAKFGEVCGTRDIYITNIAACGLALCPPADTPLGCRGGRVEVCQRGLLALADCARLGLRCEVPKDGGNAACVGGAACDPASDSATCEGAVAVRCTQEGQLVRVDCAAGPRNKRCHLGQCVPTGEECDVQVDCEGAVLAYCQDGFAHRFDCVAEGFGACAGRRCTPRPR